MRWTSSIAGHCHRSATGSVPPISAATCILLESALGFGIRVQPPAASWGNMLYQAQSAMSTEPWLARFPGLFIFVTVAAINTLGDSLAERRM